MNYLLDTHTLLWAIQETKKLSFRVTDVLTSKENVIYVSVINYWEICIKVEKKKLFLEGFRASEVPHLSQTLGFDSFKLNPQDTSTFSQLNANFHRDPFDRMLIWQALNNNFHLITKDPEIRQYEQIGLKTIW